MNRLLLLFFTFFMISACQDNQAPSIQINAPSPDQNYSNDQDLPVNVVFHGAYDIQTIDYVLTDQISGSLDVSEHTPSFLVVNDLINIVDVEPGTYTISFSVEDDSGNRNSTSSKLNIVD